MGAKFNVPFSTSMTQAPAPAAGPAPAPAPDYAQAQARMAAIQAQAMAQAQAAAEAARIKANPEKARYPVVETKEQEEAVVKELIAQGLNSEQIAKKIEKFKKRGGKIKTSAKLLKAARILGDTLAGYNPQGYQPGQPTAMLTKGLQAREDLAAQQAYAGVMQQVAPTQKLALDETLRQRDEEEAYRREARKRGIKTEDSDGSPRPMTAIKADVDAKAAQEYKRGVDAENAALQAQQQEMAEADRKQALSELELFIESGNMAGVTDELLKRTGLTVAAAAQLAADAAVRRSQERQLNQLQIRGAEQQTQLGDVQISAAENEAFDMQQWEIDKEIAQIKGDPVPAKPKLRDPLDVAKTRAMGYGRSGGRSGSRDMVQEALDKSRNKALDEAMRETRQAIADLRNMPMKAFTEGLDGNDPLDPMVYLKSMFNDLEVEGLITLDPETGAIVAIQPGLEPLVRQIFQTWGAKFPELVAQAQGMTGGPQQ